MPKRRRTDDSGIPEISGELMPPPPLPPLPGPDATAEELLAHAAALSSHITLQSYYIPSLGGMGRKSIINQHLENGSGNGHISNGNAFDFYGGRDEEDRDAEDGDERDGDYIDHLQAPSNHKKRKVPANANASSRHDTGDPHSGGEDEPTDRGIPTGRPLGSSTLNENDTVDVFQPLTNTLSVANFSGGQGRRRGKMPAVTLAGLQHKETLKSRKRQLAAVLGALSHGDTLALDQALSANYPFVNTGFDDLKNLGPPKVRLSRRSAPRLARAVSIAEKHRHPDKSPFPVCEFTYACPSPSEFWCLFVLSGRPDESQLNALTLFWKNKPLTVSSLRRKKSRCCGSASRRSWRGKQPKPQNSLHRTSSRPVCLRKARLASGLIVFVARIPIILPLPLPRKVVAMWTKPSLRGRNLRLMVAGRRKSVLPSQTLLIHITFVTTFPRDSHIPITTGVMVLFKSIIQIRRTTWVHFPCDFCRQI